MAQSKDDIKYGTAQAKVSPDESLRVAYTGGTPLEAGKIADSEFVDLFPGARKISDQHHQADRARATQEQDGVSSRDDNRH
ncbi:SEED MATURATION PROTEIN 1 [Salvia miltiorrhiza]|uniref:SEED MATURATION PROTEIN 1 n=1 Tax=Salvia miltiorrhiza TaxID=226208 RepID=UPI0025ABD570|nr:SEED MATURATION PROTEIN 1 [Salvia miltiorrhiza]